MFIFNSSIGKKFIQSVTGAFLILFLLIHVTINSFSLIDSMRGTFGNVAPDETLFSAGDGLFKLGCDFMSTPFISIMVPVLALGFFVHILYGIWLTVRNVKARGGVQRYEVSNKGAADSWAARNMFVLGIVIVGFIVFHLTQFWAEMQLAEFVGEGAANDPYLLLTTYFGNIVNLILYIIWFVALWFHLTHGFWSMFQTVGWNGQTWFKRVKVIGDIVVTIIVLLFVAVAVNAYMMA